MESKKSQEMSYWFLADLEIFQTLTLISSWFDVIPEQVIILR